ncbi:MAG: hypothetical protein ACTSWN_03555 [Promethearchaeota archaeon]
MRQDFIKKQLECKFHAGIIILLITSPFILIFTCFIRNSSMDSGVVTCSGALSSPFPSGGLPPTVNQIANLTALINETLPPLNWTITDPDDDNGSYVILQDTYVNVNDVVSLLSYRNSLLIWDNNTPILYMISNTSEPGWHNFTIAFCDESDVSNLTALALANWNASVVWLHVERPPAVLSEPLVRAYFNDTEAYYNFSIFDPDSVNGTLNVSRDGSLIYGPDVVWNVTSNNTSFSIPIDTNNTGVFNYSITVTDGNYTVVNYSIVWIATSFPPMINGLKNWTVSPDLGLLAVNFTIEDLEDENGTYTVLLNGAVLNRSFENAIWINGSLNSFNFPLIESVLSDFQIIATDPNGNTTSVNFSIYVNSPPVILDPDDATYTRSSSQQIIEWVVSDSDNATGNFTLYRNDQMITGGFTNFTWVNNSHLTLYISLTSEGTFNYTIVVTDGISIRQQSTIITVVEPPERVLSEDSINIILIVFISIGVISTLIIIFGKKK